jgi:hypothetical protein
MTKEPNPNQIPMTKPQFPKAESESDQTRPMHGAWELVIDWDLAPWSLGLYLLTACLAFTSSRFNSASSSLLM